MEANSSKFEIRTRAEYCGKQTCTVGVRRLTPNFWLLSLGSRGGNPYWSYKVANMQKSIT